MEKETGLKESMDRIKAILGDDFKHILGDDFKYVLLEDIKKHHPDLLYDLCSAATKGMSLEECGGKAEGDFTELVGDAAYENFVQYYPTAFNMFVSRVEREAVRNLADALRAQFDSENAALNADPNTVVSEYDKSIIDRAVENYQSIIREV